MARFTKDNAAELGRRGGRTTFARHGPEHMARIGVRGFWATVTRHWGGNARAYVNYFVGLGLAATDPVPGNGAFEHDRSRLRARARAGLGDRLRWGWRPPQLPDDWKEFPF